MVSFLKSGINKLKLNGEKFKISVSFDTLEARVFEKTDFQIIFERGRQ
jgi:negative regulator of genetic competence, sporulation and motility